MSPRLRRGREQRASGGARGAAWRLRWVLVLLWGLSACDVAYPEVIVINKTSEHIQLRNLSFNGCLWNTMLGYGQATAPGGASPVRIGSTSRSSTRTPTANSKWMTGPSMASAIVTVRWETPIRR